MGNHLSEYLLANGPWIAFLASSLACLAFLRANWFLRKELASWQKDQLTSLLSRRMFNEMFKRMFMHAYDRIAYADRLRRLPTLLPRDPSKGLDLSVVFVDIDHFNRVNNTYGHQVGDKVLKAVGELLSHMARQSDVCGRYGGEELVVALSTNLRGAQIFIRRFRKELQNLHVQIDDGRTVTVTVSIGAVQLEKETDDMNSLLNDADKAMYAAKQSGRDAYALLEGTEIKIYKD